MAQRILRIEVNKDNVYSVLKRIEEVFPSHRWNASLEMPTEHLPNLKAREIILYDDNTITYSENLSSDAITAEEFLSKGYKVDLRIYPLVGVLTDMFGADAVKSYLRCSAYVSRIGGENSMANCYEDLLKDLCK